MKRCWIERSASRPICPMTPWISGRGTVSDQTPRTPMPPYGWPIYHVEVDGFVFRFASLDEMTEMAEIFERRILPRTLSTASEQRAAGRAAPFWRNRHWLSRLPARVKPYKYRLKAAGYLRRAKALFADPT